MHFFIKKHLTPKEEGTTNVVFEVVGNYHHDSEQLNSKTGPTPYHRFLVHIIPTAGLQMVPPLSTRLLLDITGPVQCQSDRSSAKGFIFSLTNLVVTLEVETHLS